MRLTDNKFLPFLCLFMAQAVIYFIVDQLYGVFYQPYFWDELGVYSRASIHMNNHGLSLLPSSVPDELSRGHPLLCSFYFALAFKLFSCTPFVGHVAAALLNMGGFYFLYRILARYTTAWTAAIGTIAVFVQPLFLSQSLLLLPEMPLMVFTLGSLMAYLEDRKFLHMIFLIAALQIKESALVLPLAFILSDIFIRRKLKTPYLFYSFLIPVFTFVLFICIQKYQRGYFFYPLHTELSSFDLYFIKERWRDFMKYFLDDQGHRVICIAFSILSVCFIFLKRKTLFSYTRNKLFVIPVMFAGSLCFLVLNYYLSRYTAYFLILFYLELVLLIITCFKERTKLMVILFLLFFVNGVYHWNNEKIYTDVDFSYSNHVRSLEKTIAALNGPAYTGKTIGMGFPFVAIYWGGENGYKVSNKYKSTIMHDSLPAMDYLIFTFPGNIGDTIRYDKRIRLTETFSSGFAFTRIYEISKVDSDSMYRPNK